MQPSNKTFDFFSGTYVPGHDDLFDTVPAPKPGTVVRSTCLVCGLSLERDTERPQLCIVCGGDLPAARTFVTNKVLWADIRIERTMDTWLAALDAADDALKPRWQAFEAALTDEPAKAATAMKQARAGRADALLDIVRLYLDYQDAGEQLEQVERWADRCAEVLG